MEIPVITNMIIPAGFPSPATDYMEERISLDKELISHPEATFLIRSEGDSMINAFIPAKALLVVDRAIKPQNGDIVVAALNGDFTVKYFKRNDFKCWLLPANKKYKEIEVTGEMELIIWGVVIHIIIDPKTIRNVCFG